MACCDQHASIKRAWAASEGCSWNRTKRVAGRVEARARGDFEIVGSLSEMITILEYSHRERFILDSVVQVAQGIEIILRSKGNESRSIERTYKGWASDITWRANRFEQFFALMAPRSQICGSKISV